MTLEDLKYHREYNRKWRKANPKKWASYVRAYRLKRKTKDKTK